MPILRHLNISPDMFKANFCTLLSSFFKLSVPQNKRILSFTIINSDQSQADHKSGFLIFVFFTFRLSFCITYLTQSVACRSYMTIFSVANERFWEPQFPSCPSTSAGCFSCVCVSLCESLGPDRLGWDSSYQILGNRLHGVGGVGKPGVLRSFLLRFMDPPGSLPLYSFFWYILGWRRSPWGFWSGFMDSPRFFLIHFLMQQ